MSVIEHFTYVAARAELKDALDNFRPGGMIFLLGPSGAGKTTLRHAVMQETFGNPAYWGTGRIPVVEMVANLPHNAYFSSRELAKIVLKELHVPSLDWLFKENSSLDPATKAQFEGEVEKARSVWNQLRPRTMTEGEYWEAVLESLRARGCKYVFIDQVTSLLKNHKDTSPADHTLNLMALAERAGVMFVMSGVAKATALWAVHHELRQRVATVWFRPYSSSKSDRNHFLRLLKTLSARYRLSKPDLLGVLANDLMASTGGLLGHLIVVMEAAKRKARVEGSRCIASRHIRAAFYNDTDQAQVWRDVHEFEAASRPGNVAKRSALVEAEWRRSMDEPGSPPSDEP